MNLIFSDFKSSSTPIIFSINFFPLILPIFFSNIYKFDVCGNVSLCPIQFYELFSSIIGGVPFHPLYFAYLISMHAGRYVTLVDSNTRSICYIESAELVIPWNP